MTYSSGGLIQASDYNTLAWGSTSGGTYVDSDNLAVVWGVGTGRFGYGQSTSSFSQVAASNTVTATQWNGLLGAMTAAKNHSGATLGAMPASVTAGSVISYIGTVASNLASLKAAAGTTSGALVNSAPTNKTTAAGWQTATHTHTVTFASADAARYFFNAGGQIKITPSILNSGAARELEWYDLATKCGTITFGYRNTTESGTGTPTTLLNANNGGYWNLTTTPTTHFLMYADSAPYTPNYISIQVSWSGTAANGGYPTLTFTTLWNDAQNQALEDINAATGAALPGTQNVDNIATTSLVVASPPTTYLTNTWGTPTVS